MWIYLTSRSSKYIHSIVNFTNNMLLFHTFCEQNSSQTTKNYGINIISLFGHGGNINTKINSPIISTSRYPGYVYGQNLLLAVIYNKINNQVSNLYFYIL